MDKKDKIKRSVPSYFNPQYNVNWKALLEAHGEADNEIVEQIGQAKRQLFVETAEKTYLDSLGDNVGVYRPLELNLSDDKYRQLIEFLSFYPKQIRGLVYDVLDVFYDKTFSRYDIQTQNMAPFSLLDGNSLVFKTEGDTTISVTRYLTADGETDGANTIRLENTYGLYVGQTVQVSDNNSEVIAAQITNLTNTVVTLNKPTSQFTLDQSAIVIFDTYQYVTFSSDQFADISQATASEVAEIINAVADGATAQVLSSQTVLSLRTDTLGLKGSIQVLGGTANNALNFPTSIQSQSLRVQISEINPNEIIIRIPSTIPALRRVLKGSAHLHSDSSLTDWKGSFLYDSTVGYTVQRFKTTLNQNIVEGQVYTQLSCIDTSNIPNERGLLIFNFGRENTEVLVPYLGRPNNSTILLDPSYVFTESHSIGDQINKVLVGSTVPRSGGRDLPAYVVGIEEAREQVQEIVRSIIATGVVIRWDITYPVCGKF